MNMSFLATGDCPAPFLNLADYPEDGGYLAGRLCAPLSLMVPTANATCCLPCPFTSLVYPKSFMTYTRVASGLSAAGFVLLLFTLISMAVLPVEKTRRHYLSVCLIIAIMSELLGFVIPLAAKPQECYNDITPNDMYTSLTCAWSGAFIVAGGMGITMWLFIRVLSMHLQICWDIIPGKRFFYASQGLGWGIIAALFTTTITITGVSFRFGDACHVNNEHALKDFWGPLLGFAGAAAVLQFGTFVYCINVYLRNMWSDDQTETQSSAGQLPSYTSSVRARSARAVYRRVRKVLSLQWRSILIVIFILSDVVFLAIVFVYIDNIAAKGLASETIDRFLPWLLCLIQHNGDHTQCFEQGDHILVSQKLIIAVLMLLGLSGFQAVVLMARWSMVTGWIDLFRDKTGQKREFVSLDAQNYTAQAKAYELLKVSNPTLLDTPKSGVASTIASPQEAYTSPLGRATPDYFGSEVQRVYRSPSMSFSTPKTPYQAGGQGDNQPRVDWDPRITYARGGLGFHPPVEEDSDDGMNKKF